jgi:hypothetical protein
MKIFRQIMAALHRPREEPKPIEPPPPSPAPRSIFDNPLARRDPALRDNSIYGRGRNE